MMGKLGQTLMATAVSKIHPSICRAQPRLVFALQDTNKQAATSQIYLMQMAQQLEKCFQQHTQPS